MMDLEAYRRLQGLSYAKLADALKISTARRAQAYARGECWPDADKLARVFSKTEGVVTLEGMFQRRLQWLRETRGITLDGPKGETVN